LTPAPETTEVDEDWKHLLVSVGYGLDSL